MWNFTKDGFYSIVDKAGPNKLLVRTRTKGDLVRFCGATGLSEKRIKHTPLGDYHWRLTAPRHLVAKYLSDAAKTLDYGNVKDAIDQGDSARHSAMLGVWSAMLRLQREIMPTPAFSGPSRWDQYSPSYFRFDDNPGPDDRSLAELDDETDWFVDELALDEIRDVLNGGHWGPHSIDAIADIVRDTGRDVTETL